MGQSWAVRDYDSGCLRRSATAEQHFTPATVGMMPPDVLCGQAVNAMHPG